MNINETKPTPIAETVKHTRSVLLHGLRTHLKNLNTIIDATNVRLLAAREEVSVFERSIASFERERDDVTAALGDR